MDTSKIAIRPLPSTTEDLLANRNFSQTRTLNDYVDDIHVQLWKDKDYREALDAVYDEQAIEGSLSADNFIAAGLIRDYARDPKHPVPQVQGQKLASIVKALNIVLRRYNISRNQRAVMLHGERVGAHGAA